MCGRVSPPVVFQLPAGTAPLLRVGWKDYLDHLREEEFRMRLEALSL